MCKLSNTFETGTSNHDKLISTVAKSGIFKGKLGEKKYRSYRSFNLIQDRSGAKKVSSPTSFSPVTFANVGSSPQHFSAFSFNPFATLG